MRAEISAEDERFDREQREFMAEKVAAFEGWVKDAEERFGPHGFVGGTFAATFADYVERQVEEERL